MTDNKTSPIIMTETASTNIQVNQKKTGQAKSKTPRSKPTHPRTADMVNAAIKALKERGGSSLQAIKKYISTTYKIDAEKQAPFIKKYIKAAVESGGLVQTKGKGAAGSFKLSVRKSEVSKAKKTKSVTKTPLKTKTVGAKKPVAKKSPVKKLDVKKPTVGKVAVEKEKKKVVKGPAAKPPKAKTAAKVKVAAKSTTKKSPVKKSPMKAKAKKPVKKTTAAKKK